MGLQRDGGGRAVTDLPPAGDAATIIGPDGQVIRVVPRGPEICVRCGATKLVPSSGFGTESRLVCVSCGYET
jgi:hypothetical protein